MIKKLTLQDDTRILCGKDYMLALRYVQQTVNQLVDAVNRLEESVQGVVNNSIADGGRIRLLQEQIHALKTRLGNAQPDPYAEQCKCIGCICRFWYDNPNDTLLDYLGEIKTGKNGVEYYAEESGDWFPNCEPVLPTDNEIYKGGSND